MKQHNVRTSFMSRAFINIPTTDTAKRAGQVLHKSCRVRRNQISETCKRLPGQTLYCGFSSAALQSNVSTGQVVYFSPFLPTCTTAMGSGVICSSGAGRDFVPGSAPESFVCFIKVKQGKTGVPGRSQAVFLHPGMLQGWGQVHG